MRPDVLIHFTKKRPSDIHFGDALSLEPSVVIGVSPTAIIIGVIVVLVKGML